MILEKVKELAPTIQGWKDNDGDYHFVDRNDADLDWIITELFDHYSNKICSLAHYAYGPSAAGKSSVALQAFQKQAKNELRKGLATYLFSSQHWRTGRDVNTYLLTCLNRLADRIKLDIESAKKISVPICPACKSLGHKEYLRYESKLLRCDHCTQEVLRIETEVQNANDDLVQSKLRTRLNLHKVFQLHTRRGYRCPDCERFIPDSYIQQYGVTCLYSDCGFFGTMNEIDVMAHPLGLGKQQTVSINSLVYTDNDAGKKVEWQDFFESGDVNADVKMEVGQQYQNELEVLKSVIDSQIERIRRNESIERGRQKLLMYEAYQSMVKRFPEEMVSYLVHRKHSGAPIQSRIFQEYVRNIENALPFTITQGGCAVEVCSLLDPNLGLFLGVSEFEAAVKSDKTIPNNTIETYTGGRKLKFFGPCFIGLLTEVEDLQTGESLFDQVDSYTFVQIKMKDNVPSGTQVKVTHFRIPSHYEMGGLVYLQRIRRKVVDSVYYKLHGKKRIIRKKKN